ncbi:hypothetical protein OIV83_000198 [Microbotryomycetes sp. JL201]|nr:hypothetical protein OIV83_000198 [Microbotryomycetes sp. JL201]
MTRHTLHASGYGGRVYTLEFDSDARSLAVTSSVEAGNAPTWLTRHPTLPIVYTGDEFSEPKGKLLAFGVGPSGELSLKSTKACGAGPVSFAISKDKQHLYSANYGSGSLDSVRLEEDGSFRASDRQDQHFDFVGAGPNAERQEKPHPHQATLDPTGQWLFVPDLGADAVRIFVTGEELQQADQAHILPGNGPRHIIFAPPETAPAEPVTSPKKQPTLAYLVNELANTVSCFEVVPPPTKHDHLKLRAVGKPDISFLPPNQPAAADAGWTGAELAYTPDRQYLIISNRAPDEPKSETDHLTIFKLQPNGHIVTTEPPSFIAVGARGLRHFSLSPAAEEQPEGRYVAVAAQKTNEIVVFERRERELTEVARVKDVQQPTCVIW